MPVNDGYRGFNSGMGIFADDHRVRYFPTPQAADGELRLGWGLEVPGRGGVTAVTEVDDVPEAIRPHVKDLIDRAVAEREAAVAAAATNGVAPVRQP